MEFEFDGKHKEDVLNELRRIAISIKDGRKISGIVICVHYKDANEDGNGKTLIYGESMANNTMLINSMFRIIADLQSQKLDKSQILEFLMISLLQSFSIKNVEMKNKAKDWLDALKDIKIDEELRKKLEGEKENF